MSSWPATTGTDSLRTLLDSSPTQFIPVPFALYKQQVLNEKYERVSDPTEYMTSLEQALVRVNFNLFHWTIHDKEGGEMFNSCVARIVDVVVCKSFTPTPAAPKQKRDDSPSRETPWTRTEPGNGLSSLNLSEIKPCY